MALTQPILYNVAAFDASQSETFRFNVVGGDQVDRNKLTIKNNATLEVVYESTQTTMKFEHVLPANTLSNGVYYNATITTIGLDGAQSVPSQPIQFWCYTAPEFEFTNLGTGVVGNSSYSFMVSYAQAQNELLSSYVFNLYNDSNILISSSSTKYNTSTPPTIFSYLFVGLTNNTKYYIECNGVTAENTQITTGRIEFIVKYQSSSSSSYLTLTNNCQRGYISIQSNIIGIDGHYEKILHPEAEPTYINDKEIDLSASTKALVYWDSGFNFSNNFTASIWGRDFTPGKIIEFSDTNGNTLFIYYHVEPYKAQTSPSAWVSLHIYSAFVASGITYCIASNNLTTIPSSDTQLAIYLRKIGDWYDISISDDLAGKEDDI